MHRSVRLVGIMEQVSLLFLPVTDSPPVHLLENISNYGMSYHIIDKSYWIHLLLCLNIPPPSKDTFGLSFKVGVHTIWCHFGQFKFVQKDHFQRNTNQSYISI